MKRFIVFLITIFCIGIQSSFAQNVNDTGHAYWNSDLQITSFRLPPSPVGYKPQYIDLDGDGDPDILKTITKNDIPVMWLDDNDNMQHGDVEGDINSDCLMIDRNKDGKYGSIGDLIVDWVKPYGGQPGMQVIVDYPPTEKKKVWSAGHYMWILDTDHDGVFNYINWNAFQLRSWAHAGCCNFFPDYSGQSIFMKMHTGTQRIKDLRLNWENPFLFYDPDKDGLSEMAIRVVDAYTYSNNPNKKKNPKTIEFGGRSNWVSIAVDLDNDNRSTDEFDYDFTLGFRGKGFNYKDQVHPINMHSLRGTDSLFMDPRFRHLTELIHTDHSHAIPLIFNRGKWDKVYFVFDEDDDCHRWERVEFYDPLDPFKIGRGKRGIDNNPQSDPAGDRGEWDMDNSGHGKLYISKFDGRLHLYGAELGYWRIDQTTAYYQGWDRRIINKEPKKFATVKYEDTDGDGFFDKISYDLNGDTIYETVIRLRKLGIDDRCKLVDVSHFKYKDYEKLMKRMAGGLWKKAQLAIKFAEQYGLDIHWYARWEAASSLQQKYHNGYWLQFYIYKDLENLFLRQRDKAMLSKLHRAYYSANWKLLY